jgi:ATP-dependent Lon protease
VAFDLSKVLFIATANQLDPSPARSGTAWRSSSCPGYTFEEKQQIARIHLVPKQLREHGLSSGTTSPSRTRRLPTLITAYTRERACAVSSGASRTSAARWRWRSRAGKAEKQVITPDRVKEILGPEAFYSEVAERTEVPGVATGLAWTAVGGDLLFIEATKMAGKGGMTLTGQLGGRDEGVRPGGAQLPAQQGGLAGHQPQLPGEDGHPPPLPGGEHPPRTARRPVSPSSPR